MTSQRIGGSARPALLALAALAIAALGSARGEAQTVVGRFAPPPIAPQGRLLASGGAFYGTTASGGAFDKGTLFRVDPATGAATVLVSFDGPNGSWPLGDLVVSSGLIYGVTLSGGIIASPGSPGDGTIFRFDPGSGRLDTIARFDHRDRRLGVEPAAGLLAHEGKLYGTTMGGGAGFGGTVFRLDPETLELTTLVYFFGDNGTGPQSELIASGGYLYGTTYGDDGLTGYGTIFRLDITPPAATVSQGRWPVGLTTLVDFESPNGWSGPAPAGLVESGDYVYGTTKNGGAFGHGTIFRFDPSAPGRGPGVIRFETVASFPGAHSTHLVQSGGQLIATVETGSGPAILRLDPATGTHELQPAEGVPARADWMASGGALFGAFGQPAAVFRLDPFAPEVETIAAFAWTTGTHPYGRLLVSDGALYGTTLDGNGGSIFRFDPATGMLDTVAWLGGGRGSEPWAGLVASGGNLYGVTALGALGDDGYYGHGTIFRFDPLTSEFETVASFDGSNGSGPLYALVEHEGVLYGTTPFGGANGVGTLFAFDPGTRQLAAIASFDGGNGEEPVGELVVSGGMLYGATRSGGAFGMGTLFRLDPVSGRLETLVAFDGGHGAFPGAGLLASGGVLYGTTLGGGAHGKGTVFRLDPGSSSIRTLASFDGGSSYSLGGLIESGGNLYGTTARGGPADRGTVFRLDPASGQLQTIGSFDSSFGFPPAGVVAHGQWLYGTTTLGSLLSWGGGTLYRLANPTP